MSKNNPLRDAVRKNCNYKLYKAKKQWIYACASFLLTFGVGALASETGHAQTVENQEIDESMQSAPSSTAVVLKSKAGSVNSKTISSSQAGSEQDRVVAGVGNDTASAEDGLTKSTSAPSARDIVQQPAVTDPSGHGQDAILASQPVSQSNRVALTNKLVDDAQDTVMHFTVVVHDDTTGQDLYSYEWHDPQNGSYSDISGGFRAQTGHAANLYQSVSVDGEPAGVDWNDAEASPNVLASNYWQAFSQPGTSWWLPNYRWDDDDRSVMMGRTFTIHVVHKLSDISVTGEETTKVYDGQDGQLPQEATLTGTDQVTGQQISLRLTDKNWHWVTSDHKAPVNVGTYSLGIKQTSVKYGIAAVNTDRLKYTISPASRIVVHYRDVNGQSQPASGWNSNSGSPIDNRTQNFTGQAGTDLDLTNGWDYAAAHYQLAGENGSTHFLNGGNKSSDGNYYEGNYYIYLTHQTQQVDGADPTTIPAGKTAVALGLLKTVSRTINDQLPSGPKKVNQTATFTRTGTYDWVTNQLVPNSTSEWKVKGNNDTAYTPTIADPQYYDITVTDGDGNTLSLANNTIPALRISDPAHQTVNINYGQKMHFKLVIHDMTTGEDVYFHDFINPVNGGYIDLKWQAGLQNPENYQVISLDGEPDGVDWEHPDKNKNFFASDYWHRFNDITSWWIPNYRWDANNPAVMMGRTFTINVVHKLSDVSVTGEGTKVYDGQAGKLPGTANLTGTDQVTGQSVTLRLTADNLQWGTSDHQAPVNVGTYSLGVKQAITKYGIAAINTDQLKYTISPATATVALGGTDNKTYDGQSVTPDQLNQAGKIKVAVTIPGLTPEQRTYSLQAGDYRWYNADGSQLVEAPTAVGNYMLKLTPDGITNIKNQVARDTGTGPNGQANVQFAPNTFGGFASFAIQVGTATRYIHYQFIDGDHNNHNVGAPVVVAGKAGQELATGLVVPVEYQLASGETLPTTVTFLNQSTNPNQPTVIEIKLVHQHGRVTEAQTRQIKVHYIYGAGEHAGQQAADDAILNIYYTRTGQGDLVTGKVSDDLTTAPWLFDDTYNDDGYRNGYKVVAGSWTNLPTSWDSVKTDVPTIAGYRAILNGDWTIHRNGQQTSKPANVFVHPSYNHPGTTIEHENSIAYTDQANEYEAMPVHTIYYVPTEQTEMRTVKKYYKIYHEDGTYTDANLVTLPDGTKQSYGELGIYFSRQAKSFATHGSANPAQWEVSYGNWAWDSSLGDHGFKVISGSWSPWGHQQVIAIPTLDGYTAVALSADGKQANNTGNPVDQSQDIFTNDTAGDWLFRNRTTIFYVPSKLLSKTVIRTIKTTDPVTGAVTPVEQKVTFTRQARINNQDMGIILGGLNRDTGDFVTGDDIWDHRSTDQDGIPTGTWQKTDVAKQGYTALVDGTVSSQVDEQPVTPRTADTTVTVTYIKNAGTITISHDEVDQTYTGQVATIPSGITHAINKADSRLTWPSAAENVQLEITDFSFADENGRLIDAPSNVGTYHIVLNAHGLAKFQDLDQNFAWQYDPKKSYVVFKITQAQASAFLAGHGEKTYNSQAVSDADIQKQDANNNIKVNFTIPGDSHPTTITLAAQDFDWNGSESVPSDVATYHLTLNNQGKSAIKKLFFENHNINWTDTSFTGSATYTITPAISKVVLSGQSSKVYSGAVIKVDDINHDGSIKVTLTTNGLDPITYTLQAGDYNWLDKNGNDIAAPINAGKYYIRLKSDSLTHLQDALSTRHGNVVLDPTLKDSGQAEFDITPAARVVVHYQDVNGMTKGATGWHGAVGTHLTHDQIIDGLPNAGFAFDPTTGNWDYSNDHYVLDSQSGVSAFPSSGQLSSDGNYYLGDYYIYLKHGTHTVPFDKPADKDGLRDTDLNSSVSRKITVNMPKTTPTVIKQTVRFVRNATVDEVNGQITYGDWQVSGNTDLPAYQAPEVNGYTARPASVAKILPKLGQKVTDVIINYAANKQIVAINFVDDDNNGSQVGPTITKTGVTDQTITDFGDVQVPTNYQLAHGQILPTRYQFTADKDQTITIHLIHQTEIVDGKDQGKIPAGVDVNQLIHKARRTINDNLPSGTQTTKQTATITRTATYDKVTGKLSHFGDWTKASWEAYTPTIPAGYMASQSIVPSEAITADTKDTTVEINYNAVASAKLTGNGFSDYTGTQISFNDLNDPAHGLKIIVTGPTAHIGTLPLKQGEIEFSTDGQHWMTTLPTNAAKYRVRLTQQGINAIKAKYGNNSISWIDGSGNSTITSDASYTINPVEFAVTITGYQKALSVSDFSDTNYQVSAGLLDSSHLLMLLQSRQAALSDLVVPEGLTYQIIGEDGETFTPTTPGEYDVALTPAGLRLLQQANPNYRFKVYTKAKFALDALSLVKDTKIITETIHYRYADGNQALPDRRATITYTRHGEKDALTGEIAWETWTPNNNQTFPAVVTPAIAGYTADQTEIEAQEVVENSGDLEFTVTYQKNQQPVQPVNPVHPSNPNPGKPTLPAQPGHKDQPLPGDPGYTIKTNGEIVGSNGQIAKHGQLPQTGNNANDRSLLGMVVLSLTSLLGLGGLKKKRDNQ